MNEQLATVLAEGRSRYADNANSVRLYDVVVANLIQTGTLDHYDVTDPQALRTVLPVAMDRMIAEVGSDPLARVPFDFRAGSLGACIEWSTGEWNEEPVWGKGIDGVRNFVLEMWSVEAKRPVRH